MAFLVGELQKIGSVFYRQTPGTPSHQIMAHGLTVGNRGKKLAQTVGLFDGLQRRFPLNRLPQPIDQLIKKRLRKSAGRRRKTKQDRRLSKFFRPAISACKEIDRQIEYIVTDFRAKLLFLPPFSMIFPHLFRVSGAGEHSSSFH